MFQIRAHCRHVKIRFIVLVTRGGRSGFNLIWFDWITRLIQSQHELHPHSVWKWIRTLINIDSTGLDKNLQILSADDR